MLIAIGSTSKSTEEAINEDNDIDDGEATSEAEVQGRY